MDDFTSFKQCTKCKEIKPATTEFFHSTKQHRSYGVIGMCKVCKNIAQKNNYVKRKPIDIIPDGYKRCTKCKEVKLATLEYFPHSSRVKAGLHTYCKQCHILIHKAQYTKRQKRTFAIPDFKQCSKCGINKPATSFAKHIIGRDGLVTVCQDCQRLTRLNSYPSRRSRVLATRSLYRATHPELIKTIHRNRYAHRKGAQGKYTPNDIEKQFNAQKGKCYWCNRKLTKYHVDHIIPLVRGGSNWPDNIVIACPSCNTSKGDKLPHEWIKGGRLL